MAYGLDLDAILRNIGSRVSQANPWGDKMVMPEPEVFQGFPDLGAAPLPEPDPWTRLSLLGPGNDQGDPWSILSQMGQPGGSQRDPWAQLSAMPFQGPTSKAPPASPAGAAPHPSTGTPLAQALGALTPDQQMWADKARAAAQAAGIDPDIFARQIWQESKFDPRAGSPAGALGIAQIVPRYHPGVDPNDPNASLTYAANLMANLVKQYGGDWTQALVAYNGGQGAVNAWNSGQPYGESQAYVKAILQAQGIPTNSVVSGGDLSESQLSLAQTPLGMDAALAACGPTAYAALSKAAGRPITLTEAVEFSRGFGWNTSGGMNGFGNFTNMARAGGLNFQTGGLGDLQAQVQAGHPVVISTPGHYFVAQRYDPQTDRYYVGNTGTVYRGGSDWMTLHDMQRLTGNVNGIGWLN